ncbi:MAG: helix-turn-helix transcriptional regulator [Chryseolinea sp.]
MEPTSIEDFYREISSAPPSNLSSEIGHFNAFSIQDLLNKGNSKAEMPYNRRNYFKISLISGRNRAEYADKVIDIEKNALLYATPRIPYHWLPMDNNQAGSFCIFTSEFLGRSKSGLVLDDVPIFRPGGYPIFQLSEFESSEIAAIFVKIFHELESSYVYKYDLIRNYVMELIHYGQKLQPVSIQNPAQGAATRITSLFIELLERQFPIESPSQRLTLRAAKDYADRLAIHVNHLNKVLKEITGKTTTEIIKSRIQQEAKILLRQTSWNISEIAYSLGFEEVAHFSNSFRRRASLSPLAFRVNGNI